MKISTADNLADEMTKPLSPVVKKKLDMELDRVKKRVVGSFKGA